MKPVMYKGYTICFSNNGADHRMYVTPGEGFNPQGYANVAAAKRAITKALKGSTRL